MRSAVRAPDWIVEEACQSAWSKLVVHAEKVREEGRLSWLATTAIHDALKLIARQARHRSLETALEQGEHPTLAAPPPHEAVEQREALRLVATLPPRQQRFLMLRGMGLSYGEIALREGCTERVVERQLYQARHALRAA